MFEPVTSSRTVERVSAYASGTREPPPRTPDWAKKFPRDWARLSVGAGVLSAERANRTKNTSQFGKALRALEPAVAWLGTPGLLSRALSSDQLSDTHFTEPLTPAPKSAPATTTPTTATTATFEPHVDLAA